MKISARNVLSGTVKAVTKGATTAHVELTVGGTVVTAAITNEAVEELGLKPGMKASAVIKASDVLVATD
jgi:molybdopterin-binding protein